MLLNVFFVTGSYHGGKFGLQEPPRTAHKGRQIIIDKLTVFLRGALDAPPPPGIVLILILLAW